MAKIVPLMLMVFFFAACKGSWDNEDKQAFYGDCLEQANTWAGSQDKAKSYCDCVVEKMMKKFPNETDALEHIDSVINDPDIYSCKTDVMKK
jgi:hypothetical protein